MMICSTSTVGLLAFSLIQDIIALSVPKRPGRMLHDPILGDIDIPQPVLPNFGIKHVLDLDKYPNARCLDGTPGAYYFSPGHNKENRGQRKFYIFKQGGAFCGSYDDCASRSTSNLGSSSVQHGWEGYIDLTDRSSAPHMGFSRDKYHNPLMWDWNHVYMIYCDGGYFSGSNSTPTYLGEKQIFFNGADIMLAVLTDLSEKYKLYKAHDVVVGGCSAGGLSVYATNDWVFNAPMIPATARRAGLACSGFFLDVDIEPEWWTSRKAWPWSVMNFSQTVSSECQQAQTEFPHKCYIPEVNINFHQNPMFLWDSMFDDYALANMYGPNCEDECAKEHQERVGVAVNALWQKNELFGGFLSGCRHHCESSSLGDVSHMRPIDTLKPLQAFASWYMNHVVGEDTKGQRLWTEKVDYPCIECCPPGEEGPQKHILYELE